MSNFTVSLLEMVPFACLSYTHKLVNNCFKTQIKSLHFNSINQS